MSIYPVLRTYGWAFLLPLLVVSVSVILVSSPVFQFDSQALSLGITLDLMLTAPLLYFLLIRKKPISKLTVIPWLVGGILMANAILPSAPQSLARLAATYLLPLVELGVLSFIGYRVYQLIRTYRSSGSQSKDFLTGVHQSTQQVFGKGLPAVLLASEIAVFYYGLLKWKTTGLSPNQFTYHRKAPIKPVLAAIMFVVVIETVALHFLIQIWSPLAAWIVTGLSIYSLLWVIAQWKAMAFRPLIVENQHLYLRNGMGFECTIPLNRLAEITVVKNVNKKTGKVLSLLPDMESPNIQFLLHEPVAVSSLYGKTTKEQTLFMKVDDAQALEAYLQAALP